jgi:hypothetical protein
MKHLKILGLAVVAAVAMTALFGAGSAAATVLCSTAVNPCPVGEKYTIGSALDASLQTSTTWEASSEPVNTCTGSTIAGKTTSSGSATETIVLKLESLTFANCTRTTTVLTRGELQIHSIAGTTNGTITSRGITGEIAGPLVPCGWNFGSEWTHFGKIVGGNPAVIELAVPVIGSCPINGLTGTYTITSPKPLYVVAS